MTSLAMRARILAFTCSLMCVATAAVAETARYEIDPSIRPSDSAPDI